MKKTQTNKVSIIKEDVSSANISPISYMVFIDISSYLSKGRGLLSSMFAAKPSESITKWFGKVKEDETYKENEEAFKAISSRFMGNPILKKLYSSIDKLKTVSTGETDQSERDKDIEKLLGKISLFIKNRLTKKERELIGKMSTVVNSIGNNISSAIKSDLEAMAKAEEPEKPKEEPKEEPKKEPVKPIEAPKVEGKVNERLKNKIQPTNENFPGPGEIVGAKDLDYDMLSYFNRMNKKLSIDTKTKKGIYGSVAKMYGNFVFNGDTIDKKDILQVKILESNVNERLKNKLRKKIKEIIRTHIIKLK